MKRVNQLPFGQKVTAKAVIGGETIELEVTSTAAEEQMIELMF